MNRRIVVVGSANRDLVVKAERIAAPGETVGGGVFVTAAGGKGANQAVAAARLGADVSFVGCIGTDAFGDALAGEMSAAGVRIDQLRRDPSAATGVALIGVDAAGQNAITVAPGANHSVTPEDILAVTEIIAGAFALVVQLEIPSEVVRTAIETARAHDVMVILNPAPLLGVAPLPDSLLAMVDILVPNDHEAAYLLGHESSERLDWAHTAERLRAKVRGAVIITLGAEGCILADATGVTRIPAYPVQAIDSTAAGDCFTGAIAAALADGQPLNAAARFAGRAAALSVTRMGAQPSLPTRAEVDALQNRS